MEIRTLHQTRFYLGSNEEIIQSWFVAIQSIRPTRQVAKRHSSVELLTSSHQSANLGILSSSNHSVVIASPRKLFSKEDSKLILNRSIIHFQRSPLSMHPCAVIAELLTELLLIFEEFSSSAFPAESPYSLRSSLSPLIPSSAHSSFGKSPLRPTSHAISFPPSILYRYREFCQKICILQLVDCWELVTQAERVSFFLNLLHTLVVHSRY